MSRIQHSADIAKSISTGKARQRVFHFEPGAVVFIFPFQEFEFCPELVKNDN